MPASSSKCRPPCSLWPALTWTSNHGTLYRDNTAGTESAITVPAIDLADIVAAVGGYIDILKVDCEGCEWVIFGGKKDLLRAQVRYVALEYHEFAGRNHAQLVALFEQAGFACRATPPNKLNNGMLYATARRP